MPLSSASSVYLHILQNASLIALAAFFIPLCTFIAITSYILSPFLGISKQIKHRRKWRELSSPTFHPRTVLVTGVGTSKGLALARAFYRAGHRVIGADFEPYMIPVCGRFSTSIDTFYRLSKPSPEAGSARHIRDLKDLVNKEEVELWVSCSSEPSIIEDGSAAEYIERETNCKVVQFGLKLTDTLNEKDSFIKNTRNLGLNVLERYLIASEKEALAILSPKDTQAQTYRYTMKTSVPENLARTDLTLFPRPTLEETKFYIKCLHPSPSHSFVLQRFISGINYYTHALVIAGKVKAFVACPSADKPMHYTPLASSSALSRALLLYTSIYAEKTGTGMNGHLSIEFLVDEKIAPRAEKIFGASEKEIEMLLGKIYATKCRPWADTAVVLFADVAEDMAEAYLSILPNHEPKGISNGHRSETVVVPRPGQPAYYWIGHDLVAKCLLPLLGFLKSEVGLKRMLGMWLEFIEHVVFWREGTFEVWDPWPAWWLYVGYWPLALLVKMWGRRWWSECNVNTTELFGC